MQLANIVRERWKGVLFCLIIAIPATLLGKQIEVVGGPVFAILFGMVLALVFPKNRREQLAAGVTYTSKKVLQYAVILLGFGMNLSQILSKGAQSLPIIVATISTSLVIAFVLCRVMNVPSKIATLVGVGSSIWSGLVDGLRGEIMLRASTKSRFRDSFSPFREFSLFLMSSNWLSGTIGTVGTALNPRFLNL